jgi:hypothetical protein
MSAYALEFTPMSTSVSVDNIRESENVVRVFEVLSIDQAHKRSGQ